jgi:hypothetical protein
MAPARRCVCGRAPALLVMLALAAAACGGSAARSDRDGSAADTMTVLDDDGGAEDARDGRAHADAPVDAGACWAEGECAAPATCLAPGDESCPPCPKPTADCATDSACADQGPIWICEPSACGCFHQCVPGCTSDSTCPAWTTCGADHRCGPKLCAGDGGGGCPANFLCGTDGRCARQSCTDDGDCKGACVKGLCYDRPGTCTAPPAGV